MTRLSIRGLAKKYEKTFAVEGVNLEIEEGEFVSLLGPSGCGKTTTLRCVAGLELPTEGSISFDDEIVTNVPPERRSIGMVFQSYALFPHMTVGENIGFGLEMRGIRGSRADNLVTSVLEMVQLANSEARFPRHLSGGQQQRVALARALVFEPKLLLLDEPLANLDAKLRDEMRYFIRTIQQRVGITTLYVTHDQAESMAMSDRIVVMFGGKIHQIGSAKDIYQRPSSREVAGFIGQANLIDAKIVGKNQSRHVLQTTFGRIEAQGLGEFTSDQDVQVSIRPEDVCLHRKTAKDRIAALVTEVHFLGNLVNYKIRVADGTIITIQSVGGMELQIESQVFVTFNEDKAWIIA